MSWTRLHKRVFEIDIQQCRHCGGTAENQMQGGLGAPFAP
jgi:hypothetical protein